MILGNMKMKRNKRVEKVEPEKISLSEGSGGKEMQDLIESLGISFRGDWKNCSDDSAVLSLPDNSLLAFTTDSFVADPLFFPGGDIGKIAFCGTVNDLLVMGASPLGISLALIIEEGFPKNDLNKIILSLRFLSEKTKIPIVTGDTKVMENGKIDKIVINTSGVGLLKEKDLLSKDIHAGDKIILSGSLGEHAVALLSKRFDYKTSVITDSKPFIEEMDAVREKIKLAKDPTRGGLASCLNEISKSRKVGIVVYEDKIPVKEEVKSVTEMLGINVYELACEGRFICVTSESKAREVEAILKRFNKDAAIIGEVSEGDKVIMSTVLGKRVLPNPIGRIVPRIC